MKTFFIPLAILTIASSSALAHDWDSNQTRGMSLSVPPLTHMRRLIC